MNNNTNVIIVILLTALVVIGVFMLMDKKKETPVIAPTVTRTIREVETQAPANDDDSIEFKLNRKIKL